MSIIENIKQHRFSYFVLLTVIILFVSEVAGLFLVIKNNQEIDGLKNKIDNNYTELQNTIKNTKLETNNTIKNLELEVNSRIDILDSAVKADEKQQMLFKKTRDAIKENTASNPNIRVLNKITLLVIKYAQNYNLSIADVLAQIRQESDFRQEAVSHAGAIGILQVMPDTFKYVASMMGRVGLNMYNVEDNLNVGCYYMAEQLHKFGNFEDALRAYNAGPNWVRKVEAAEVNEYPKETVIYVKEVLKWREIFKQYGLE